MRLPSYKEKESIYSLDIAKDDLREEQFDFSLNIIILSANISF